MLMRVLKIDEKEYMLKKLEVAKHLLPTMVGQHTEEYMIDVRKRASLIYNCVAISDHLLREVGYRCASGAGAKKIKTEPSSGEEPGDTTAIRELGQFLKDNSSDNNKK